MVDLSVYRRIGKLKMFKKNEVVFTQNTVGQDMYIVLKGVFGVYINSFTDFPVRVAEIGADAFFGEMSVIDGWPRSATIISEEQSMAVSIEKSSFTSLLEAAPEITVKILQTLSGRVAATTETARKKGITVTDLPDSLSNPVSDNDPAKDLEKMLLLAQRIRELNELLSGSAQNEIEKKETNETVMLLPQWHERFTETDVYDSAKILAKWDYVCPYCEKGFKDRIPLFSRLEEKGKTLDQRLIYSNFNILMYTNIICPNCNYCDTYQEFQKIPRPLRIPTVEGNRFKNFENFDGYENEVKHTLDESVLSYYLNLRCLRQIGGSELRQAKAWHRLYWLYYDFGKAKEAESVVGNAIECYMIYINRERDNLPAENLMTINLILAELLIASGSVKKAEKYLAENTAVSGFTSHELARKSLARLREIQK